MEWIKWIGDNLIVISVIIGVGTVFYYIVRWFVLTNYIVKKDIPKLEENYKNDIKSIKEDIKEIRNWIVNALFKTENQTVSCLDAKIYSGFAFGLGIDRLCIMKHKITDIRYFHSGNLKFSRQFI